MGIDLPKLLAALPMSVIRRESSKASLVTLDVNDKEFSQVCLDVQDEYNFSDELFCLTEPNRRTFYDGTQKILEYFYDGQNITIHFFTLKQSNLFIDITAEKCIIHALGPLCLQGNFEVTHQYSIKAKALILDGNVICEDTIKLSTEEDLTVFGEISTLKYSIQAAVYNQSAKIAARQFFDLSAQVFYQTKNAVFNTPTLRLVSEISKIEGHFVITSNCFVAVSHLALGATGPRNVIQFPTCHHVHASTMMVQGDAQVFIGEHGSISQEALWVIDEDFEIDELSSLYCHQVNLQCTNIYCAGSAQFDDSLVKVEALVSRNNFSFLSSKLDAKSIDIESGQFSISGTRINAKKIRALSGEILIQDSSGLVLHTNQFAINLSYLL